MSITTEAPTAEHADPPLTAAHLQLLLKEHDEQSQSNSPWFTGHAGHEPNYAPHVVQWSDFDWTPAPAHTCLHCTEPAVLLLFGVDELTYVCRDHVPSDCSAWHGALTLTPFEIKDYKQAARDRLNQAAGRK